MKKQNQENKVTNVMFVCSDNASRSQMAEVLMNIAGKGQFWACSAGLNPADSIDETSRAILHDICPDYHDLTPKSISDLCSPNHPYVDLVICLDDAISDEDLSIIPGEPNVLRWHEDSRKLMEGSLQNRLAGYQRVLRNLEDLIMALVSAASDSSLEACGYKRMVHPERVSAEHIAPAA